MALDYKKKLSILLVTIISLSGCNTIKCNPYENDPLLDHKKLISEFVKQEQKCPYGGKEKPIMLVKQPGYDSSDEYRKIIIWNIPALSEGNSLTRCFLNAMIETHEELIYHAKEMVKFGGKFEALLDYVNKRLASRPAIIQLARIFDEKPDIIASSVLCSFADTLLEQPEINKFGAFLDIASLVALAIGIGCAGFAVYGAVQGAGAACVHVGANAAKHSVVANIGKILCAGAKPVANESLKRCRKLMMHWAAEKICCDGACVMYGAAGGAAVLGVGAAGGSMFARLLNYILNSSISNQFKREKIFNFANLFKELRDKMKEVSHRRLNGNALVVAVDQRKFSTFLFWNRYRKNKRHFVEFRDIPGLRYSPYICANSSVMLDCLEFTKWYGDEGVQYIAKQVKYGFETQDPKTQAQENCFIF